MIDIERDRSERAFLMGRLARFNGLPWISNPFVVRHYLFSPKGRELPESWISGWSAEDKRQCASTSQ